ncbi:hypothetical protein BDR04DRAFT_12616 [Suillus decipiens]|nr:hypothetical protein BDR04DRAFT_12616 [Suillus decipiens]
MQKVGIYANKVSYTPKEFHYNCIFHTIYCPSHWCNGCLKLHDNLYDDLGFNGGLVSILGALYVAVAIVANFLASFVVDFVRRVRLLSMFCSTLTCRFLIHRNRTLAGLGCTKEAEYVDIHDRVGNSFGVFLISYFIFYARPLIQLHEIFPPHIRLQGMAFSTILLNMQDHLRSPLSDGTIKYVMLICLTTVHFTTLWRRFPEVNPPPSNFLLLDCFTT